MWAVCHGAQGMSIVPDSKVLRMLCFWLLTLLLSKGGSGVRMVVLGHSQQGWGHSMWAHMLLSLCGGSRHEHTCRCTHVQSEVCPDHCENVKTTLLEMRSPPSHFLPTIKAMALALLGRRKSPEPYSFHFSIPESFLDFTSAP